jgi:phospholipid/cholesterol/gamma-HCH transport system substrate-binding protein
MRQNKGLEVLVGVFVAAGLGALFVLAMRTSNLSTFTEERGFLLKARFENVGGLKVRSPVSVAGVRVGRVANIDFDADTFQAVVTMDLSAKYRGALPEDTSASIFTAGLLGEQYVSLEPGGSEVVLEDGDEIQLTQSALVMEQVVGKFLFSKAAEGEP